VKDSFTLKGQEAELQSFTRLRGLARLDARRERGMDPSLRDRALYYIRTAATIRSPDQHSRTWACRSGPLAYLKLRLLEKLGLIASEREAAASIRRYVNRLIKTLPPDRATRRLQRRGRTRGALALLQTIPAAEERNGRRCPGYGTAIDQSIAELKQLRSYRQLHCDAEGACAVARQGPV